MVALTTTTTETLMVRLLLPAILVCHPYFNSAQITGATRGRQRLRVLPGGFKVSPFEIYRREVLCRPDVAATSAPVTRVSSNRALFPLKRKELIPIERA